jgi:hypothetical protein
MCSAILFSWRVCRLNQARMMMGDIMSSYLLQCDSFDEGKRNMADFSGRYDRVTEMVKL